MQWTTRIKTIARKDPDDTVQPNDAVRHDFTWVAGTEPCVRGLLLIATDVRVVRGDAGGNPAFGVTERSRASRMVKKDFLLDD
jgi:hypothetical protein